MKRSLLMQKLNRLIEAGIVIKNGNFYCFTDKLLRHWIKYVFQKRVRSLQDIYIKFEKEFIEEISHSIDEFILASKKHFSTRIIELLHCFDNEAFNVQGRKYKLPLFREIVPFYFVANEQEPSFDVIKASTQEGIWFIIFKREPFVENEVNTFLIQSKKLKKKPLRCIMISLSDLDESARIRALQERMWIWNERELNTLLNLYDKPYIL
jgi:hypothetical protein